MRLHRSRTTINNRLLTESLAFIVCIFSTDIESAWGGLLIRIRDLQGPATATTELLRNTASGTKKYQPEEQRKRTNEQMNIEVKDSDDRLSSCSPLGGWGQIVLPYHLQFVLLLARAWNYLPAIQSFYYYFLVLLVRKACWRSIK